VSGTKEMAGYTERRTEHVGSMQDILIPKQVLQYKLKEKRNIGGP
jgi:hypothetical protein